MRDQNGRLPLPAKIRLILRVLFAYIDVMTHVNREPLPDIAARYAATTRSREPHSPRRLSRAVYRTLHLGPYRPRCVINALVLFRLIREQSDRAQLIVGLPENPSSHIAHAWVEFNGIDIGPPPGRGAHIEFARYG